MSRAGTSLIGYEHLHFGRRRRKLPVPATFVKTAVLAIRSTPASCDFSRFMNNHMPSDGLIAVHCRQHLRVKISRSNRRIHGG
jgi:hypothetical protein